MNETSELVCISTALNKFTKKNPVTLSPNEALGTKNQCGYIRKFTPLGRYFGVAKRSNGVINPLVQSKEKSLQDSCPSFNDDEFVQDRNDNRTEFLKHAKLKQYTKLMTVTTPTANITDDDFKIPR